MVVRKYKVKNGFKWYVSICKRGKRFFRRGFDSKEEAMAKGLELLTGPETKKLRAPLFSDLCLAYLDNYTMKTKISTSYGYKMTFRKHIGNAFKGLRVDEITYADLDQWWNRVKRDRTYKDKNKLLNMMIAVFGYADLYFRCCNREVEKLIPYKNYKVVKDENKRRKFLSPEEFKAFIKVVHSPYFRTFFMFAYFSGCRISEIRGLQLEELPIKVVRIYQQAYPKTGSGKTIILNTKTKSSKGVLALPPFIIDMLNEHCINERLNIGDYVFHSPNKKYYPIGETTINRALKAYSDSSGIKVNMHMFRHSEATLLDGKGVASKTIAKVLRHSSNKVTENFYIHETEEERNKVVDILETYKDYFD